MSQSHMMSFVEASANILIGYGIAVTAQTIIFPVFGIHIPLSDHLLMGGFFTIVSLTRSYFLRRIFNWLHTRGIGHAQ